MSPRAPGPAALRCEGPASGSHLRAATTIIRVEIGIVVLLGMTRFLCRPLTMRLEEDGVIQVGDDD